MKDFQFSVWLVLGEFQNLFYFWVIQIYTQWFDVKCVQKKLTVRGRTDHSGTMEVCLKAVSQKTAWHS